VYLYRGSGSQEGNTIEFMLTQTLGEFCVSEAFLREKTFACQAHAFPPRVINVDKDPSTQGGGRAQAQGHLAEGCKLRPVKYHRII